jgi:hypothetical protein
MYSFNGNMKLFIVTEDSLNATSTADMAQRELAAFLNGTTFTNLDGGSVNGGSELTFGTPFSLVGKSVDDTLHYSPVLNPRNIKNLSYRAYTAKAEQVDYIGWNGTAGTLEEVTYNNYMLKVLYKHDKAMWSEQKNIRVYSHEVGATASSKLILKSISAQVNMDKDSKLKAEIVANTATETALSGSCTITATYLSDTLVASASNHGVVVGDVIRVAATGTANPVYIVTAVDGANISIHTPYQGTTAATLASKIVTAITNWGLKLTGLPITWKAKGIMPYVVAMWDLQLSGFGETPVTNSVKPTKGSGHPYDIADLEWFANGGDGLRNRTVVPISEGRTDVDLTKTGYGIVSFEYQETGSTGPVAALSTARSFYYICIDQAASNAIADIVGNLQTSTGTTAL